MLVILCAECWGSSPPETLSASRKQANGAESEAHQMIASQPVSVDRPAKDKPWWAKLKQGFNRFREGRKRFRESKIGATIREAAKSAANIIPGGFCVDIEDPVCFLKDEPAPIFKLIDVWKDPERKTVDW